MKIVTKIEISFDTDYIGIDTTDWTKDDFKSYYVETFIEDINTLINNNNNVDIIGDEIKNMISVEVIE